MQTQCCTGAHCSPLGYFTIQSAIPGLRRCGAARMATGALARSLARSFVHCNIVKSPSFHHDYLLSFFRTISPSLSLSLNLRNPPSRTFPSTRSHRLALENAIPVLFLSFFPPPPFSVIVRVFRILRIIYERLPLPVTIEARRRCKSGQRARNFAG